MAELYIRGKDGRPRLIGSTADPQLPGRMTALEERMGALESAPGGPGFVLPVATADTLGGVRPDGCTFVVDEDGIGSVVGYRGATPSSPGTAGILPAAGAGSFNRFLSAGGVWEQGTTRSIVTGTVTLFVRQDGDDGNDGSSDDAAHAFKTLNAALGYVSEKLFLSYANIVIQVSEGVFSDAFTIPTPSGRGGRIIIRGSGADTVIARTDAVCVYGAYGSYVEIENLKFLARRTADISYGAIGAQAASGVVLRNVAIEIEDNSSSQKQFTPLICYRRSGMLILSDVSIALAGTNEHSFPTIMMQGGYASLAGTITVNGAGSEFIRCTNGSLVTCYGSNVSFAGSFSGKRYLIETMSCIDTNGQGPDFLPGDAPGTCDESSAYL